MLLNDFRENPSVQSFHMSYKQINEQKVMFLYKFVKGECPNSFGINVARMAGISGSILDRAAKKSAEFSNNLEDVKKRSEQK